MTWLLSLGGFLFKLWCWAHDRVQQTLGRKEQENADLKKTNSILKNELDAAAASPDTADELRRGNF